MTTTKILRTCLAMSIFSLVMACTTFAGKTIYVDDDGPADFNNIQAAIDAAVNGGVVVVTPGTYTGDGNRDIDFHGKAITVRSVDPNDPNTVAATIIDCNGTVEEKHCAFYFHSGEDCNSVLCGLAITNGYADYGGAIYCVSSSPTITNCTFRDNTAQYWWFSSLTPLENTGPMVNDDTGVHIMIPPPLPGWRGKGGGISCRSSNPTLTNCKFIGNSAYERGGGMFNYYNSSPILTNCTFAANSALYGGGMRNSSSSPNLFNCIFNGNSAGLAGGGMYNWESSPAVSNCIFNGNSAGWGGGCMSNYRSSPMLTNCTFNRNSAIWGGAIFNTGSDATLSNCILWGNTATKGNEIHLDFYTDFRGAEYPSIINVDYSDVDGGAAGVYVDTDCTLDWGTGNIDEDPCFANMGYWDPNGTPEDANDDFWVDGDYHLKSQAGRWDVNEGRWTKDDVTSPCIDVGNQSSPIGLEPFPNGGVINMGAYGGTAEASKSYFGEPVCETVVAGDINGDCKVNFKDFAFIAYHWLRDENP